VTRDSSLVASEKKSGNLKVKNQSVKFKIILDRTNRIDISHRGYREFLIFSSKFLVFFDSG